MSAILPIVGLVAGLFAAAADDDVRDVVKLRAGSELKGRVVFQDDDRVILRVGSRERAIQMKDVASVDSVIASMEEVLDRIRKLPDADVAGHLDLAAFCTEKKLPKMAALEALHVLRLDPKNEKAHEILKHRRGESTWFATIDGAEVAWGLVEKVTADWGKALRVDSEHFSVKSNAGLAAAVDLARDLEFEYSAFYANVGADVEMHEILEPIGVNAYRTKKDWPSGGSHVGGYFESGERVLYVYYTELPGRPQGLFHEAVHAILYMAIERSKSGSTPPWVSEGLAEYFDACMQGPLGKPEFKFGAKKRGAFETVAAATKQTSLNRILNYDGGDFLASTNQSLKYAEAYSLVHFLIHGDTESYRPKFADYLRGAFQSKATSGRFEKSMGKSLDAIEKAWRKYVAENAKP